MKREFSIIKRELSMDEKQARLNMFNLYKPPYEPSVDPIEFLSRKIYDETIHLKCTKCKYDEIADYEIIEEITFGMDYPMLECPKCSYTKLKGTLVPIDIYNSDFK